MDLTQLLLATQEGDNKIRGAAEKQLAEYEQARFAEFLGALVQELGTDSKPDATREAAAIQIKRILTGQDEISRKVKEELWRHRLDDGAREITKTHVLRVLATAPVKVSRQAAQCVEAIARLELAEGRWNDLPKFLVEAFDHVYARDPSQIIGPLQALGYFAQLAAHTNFDIQEEQINALLSKISAGMNQRMPEVVQVAATEALADTLDFARHNMDNDQERAVIMQMILDMTHSKSGKAREKAFQCLTNVLTMYYHHLPQHMEAIWQTTVAAIRDADNDEQVAKQALNFWDEMAYEETERAANAAPSPQDQSFNFISKVMDPLCQIVLDFCLVYQPEEVDDEDNTDDSLYGSAEHCFVSLCGCLGTKLLPATLSFVSQNLVHRDWRRRQAAVFAFGSVVREITDSAALVEPINAIFPRVVAMTTAEEPIATVRETAAWAIAMVTGSHLKAVQNTTVLAMINAMLEGLRDKPRVAHMAATAIHAFAGAFADKSGARPQSNPLSGVLFEQLAAALWDAARRNDSDQRQLMEDAYEALIKLVEVSAVDMEEIVGGVLLGHALLRLGEIRAGTVRDQTGYQEVELCDLVNACVLRLDAGIFNFSMPGVPRQGPSDVIPNKIVETMINVLNKPSSNAHPGALAAIAEVTRIVGPKFAVYSDHVMPFVYAGLRNHANAQTCIAAVRLCSDICTAMESAMLPVVKNIMALVYENLRSKDSQPEIKPPHLTILGDIASAIGFDKFQEHFSLAMVTCINAAALDVDVTDDEMADFLNKVREAAIEAMEMMLLEAQAQHLGEARFIYDLGLQISKEVQDPRNYWAGKAHAPNFDDLQLSYRVSPAVIKATLGVLGDTAKKLGDNFAKPIRENQLFFPLFQAGLRSGDEDIEGVAKYACQCVGINPARIA